MIISLPPNEPESQQIIADAIYNHSSTLNGQHFAEEFLKKRKTLGSAVDATTPGTSPVSTGGGWNEVLKKEKTVKDPSGEWNSAFKVVAGKKGRRRG
jgi:PERQ amino acid-rich with GYF domain-containing protein